MARRVTLLTAVATAAIAVCLTVVGCSPPLPREAPPPVPSPTAEAVRMAAVGDSITDGDSIDFADGIPGPQSWATYAISPEVDFVGGWAEWGATTERMVSGMQGPFDADVLVIVAGTNDAGWISHDEIGANMVRIADEAAVDQVVLSSVPPSNFAGTNKVELNTYLERFASVRGWHWVDAAAGLRSGDSFAEGMSYDGIHLTEEGAQVLGEAIGTAVIDAARYGG
ncbi:MAG: SGNH/GDSL hydrolase family protein [Leucobacter sp.]